jgi:type II secretory pathway pseudopilin PulG
MRLLFPHRPRSRSRQSGYMLLLILLMSAIVMLAVLKSAPAIGQQIRREREEELIRRGKQYAIAIKRFYKKTGAYPTSLEQLENTNRMRFLRRRFKDPMSESGEWRLIRFGEVKTTPTGLFGKPIGATGAQGGAVGTPVSAMGGGPGSQGTSSPGQPAGGSSSGLTGRTFGGGPIVGVASTSTQQSIKELNGKDHYNDWEFFYDPRFDVGPGGVPIAPQQQPGQPIAPGAGPQQNPSVPNQNPGMPR